MRSGAISVLASTATSTVINIGEIIHLLISQSIDTPKEVLARLLELSIELASVSPTEATMAHMLQFNALATGKCGEQPSNFDDAIQLAKTSLNALLTSNDE